MSKQNQGFRLTAQSVCQGIPTLFRDPGVFKNLLVKAKKAQVALILTILLLPYALIPAVDTALEKLYPDKQIMGIFPKSDPRLPQRKDQAHILLWSLAAGAVLVLLLIDLPKRIEENRTREAGAGFPPEGETIMGGAAPPDVSIGPKGRYLLGEELGRGAMGVVYRAFDRVLEREVAFKELPIQLALMEERVDRFRQEARTLARLSHPGIVQVYDLVEEGGRIFLAMELVPGGSLEDVLPKFAPLSRSVAVRYGAAVADALGYIHSRGVVHRDLKPANILISADDQPKITDFGIARLGDSQLTADGAIMGSPEYMSPEQATGKPIDARSDIYSLGILLYQLFTGTKPFAGEVGSVLAQQISCEAQTPDKRTPDLPQEINDLILALLRKNPQEREQDLNRVSQILRTYAA